MMPEDVTIEQCAKRVRVLFAGETIADSRHVRLLLERGLPPVYYFPWADVRPELLRPSEHRTHCPRKGEASYWSVVVGERAAADAVWSYPAPLPHCPDISGLAAFYWDRMDAWYEEDEEVFVHPRDPHTRIDVLESSRHVQVSIGDVTVADSTRPLVLFETGLRPRFYLPKVDVRMELLSPTETETACPYKGITSQYWTVTAGGATIEDAAWCYEYPTPETCRIAGRIAFYNERVDFYLDGELQDG